MNNIDNDNIDNTDATRRLTRALETTDELVNAANLTVRLHSIFKEGGMDPDAATALSAHTYQHIAEEVFRANRAEHPGSGTEESMTGNPLLDALFGSKREEKCSCSRCQAEEKKSHEKGESDGQAEDGSDQHVGEGDS